MSTRLLSSWPQHLHSCLILDCSLQFLKWRCFLFFFFYLNHLQASERLLKGQKPLKLSFEHAETRWRLPLIHFCNSSSCACAGKLSTSGQHVKDAVQKTKPSSAGSGRRRNKERLCIWHGICRHRWRKVVLGKQRSPSLSQHNVAVCGTTSNMPLMPIKTAVSENNQGN